MPPTIVEHPQAAPGVCFLSGDNEGKMIDTGRSVQGTGRIYLSLKHLGPLLRANGWTDQDDSAGLLYENECLERAADELQGEVLKFRRLLEVIQEFVPEPEPVERQVLKVEVREPTDEDVAKWVRDHPHAIERFKPAVRGSIDQWNEIYRPDAVKSSRKAALALVEQEAPPTSDSSEGEAPAAPDPAAAPPRLFEEQGTELDLDDVLSHNVQTIEAFAEGHSQGFREALAARERWLAGQPGREDKPARKTVLRLADPVEVS